MNPYAYNSCFDVEYYRLRAYQSNPKRSDSYRDAQTGLYDRPKDTPWSCQLFFGYRTTRDIFYLKQLELLAKKHPNFHVVYALSDRLAKGEKWDGETEFIHLSVDKKPEKGIPRQAFLCGPPPMINAVTKVLEEKGISAEDIFYDEF